MKVRPLHDRILPKRIEEKESVKGGIIIPDTAKENLRKLWWLPLEMADSGKWNQADVGRERGRSRSLWEVFGSEIKVDGEEYLIVREDDVLGILAESAKSKAAK
jgi:chaperonin GroES